MLSCNDLRALYKARLGSSSLENWSSYLENSPGETMHHPSRVSLLGRIAAFLRTPRGLAVVCILWPVFLIALVFVFTLLTSWEIRLGATGVSLTAASPWERNSAGLTDRRLSFCQPRRLEGLKVSLGGNPFFWILGMPVKTVCHIPYDCEELDYHARAI